MFIIIGNLPVVYALMLSEIKRETYAGFYSANINGKTLLWLL